MDIGGEDIDDILLKAGATLNTQQNGGDNPDVNISDVLDAINRAESYSVEEMSHVKPYVEIIEQPASKGLRFRYECEGRSAGSIPGANSTPENKTYPTIRIHGYRGPATIVASCITKDGFFVHPHNLVGKNCNQGVCSFRAMIKDDACEYQFKNLGIQCVKRRDITHALSARMKHGIDPFQKGFDHQRDPLKIDLNCVRLAIQAIVKDEAGKDVSLRPVYTDVIYDKKSTSDLLIMRASHCSGPAGGGLQVILLCEKLVQAAREDTVVAFYEEEGERELWTREVAPSLVHKQYAIVFELPPYRLADIDEPVRVRFQLRRRSDRERSNWLEFEYFPDATKDPRKKRKAIPSMLHAYHKPERIVQPIKLEPREMTPHQMSSPPHPMFTYTHPPEMQWGERAGGLQAFGQTLPWNTFPDAHSLSPAAHASPALGHISPAGPHTSSALGHMSPAGPHASPALGHMSPGAPHASPALGSVSPALGQPSPDMRLTSPGMGYSPGIGQQSPHMGHVSPRLEHGSPHDAAMGHMSPALQQPLYQMVGQQQMQMQQQHQQLQQQQQQQQASGMEPMEQSASLSELLRGVGEAGELFLPDNLSDSLNRLSTDDLNWPPS